MELAKALALMSPLLAACGGHRGPPGPPVAPAALRADARSPVAVDSARGGAPLPFSTATVPVAAMPPAFHFGSRKADKKPSAGADACVNAFRVGGDLASDVQKLGKACSDKVKTRPLTAPWTGAQTQGAAAQKYKLKAEAGRCYRAYSVAASSVTSLTVMVVDSTGAVAWESRSDEPRVALPENGLLCFKAADDAVVTVSVGGGEGAYAVQMWTDQP